MVTLESLIWAIHKLLEIIFHAHSSISLYFMLSSYRLCNTHAPRCIDTEDNRDIFTNILSYSCVAIFVLDLCRGLQYITDCLLLGSLFLLDRCKVYCIAELALPGLLATYEIYLTVHVEYACALLADIGITCGKFSIFIQTAHADLENICINLLLIFFLGLNILRHCKISWYTFFLLGWGSNRSFPLSFINIIWILLSLYSIICLLE